MAICARRKKPCPRADKRVRRQAQGHRAIEDPPLITKIPGQVQRREALTSAPRAPPDSKEALHLT